MSTLVSKRANVFRGKGGFAALAHHSLANSEDTRYTEDGRVKMTEDEIYALPFSIERFKMLPYHPDLEVMISVDGTVYYAHPSHQEFLIAKAMERLGCSRDELFDMCPPEYHFDFMNWLIMQSGGYIPVWPRFFLGGPLTNAQWLSLRKLKMGKVFRGPIPSKRNCVLNK